MLTCLNILMKTETELCRQAENTNIAMQSRDQYIQPFADSLHPRPKTRIPSAPQSGKHIF